MMVSRAIFFFLIILTYVFSCFSTQANGFDLQELLAYADSNAVERLLAEGLDLNAPVTNDWIRGSDNRNSIFFAFTPAMIKYLVEKGADPHHRSSNGQLPIDYAYELRFYDAVEYLARNYPYNNTNTVCGYPERLLEYLISIGSGTNAAAVYISVNNEEPDPELMHWIKGKIPHAKPYKFDRKSGIVTEQGVSYQRDEWQAEKKKIHEGKDVTFFSFMVKKGFGRKWSFSRAWNQGPLSGWFGTGTYQYIRKYNHWIVIKSSGGMG